MAFPDLLGELSEKVVLHAQLLGERHRIGRKLRDSLR
jgi:hypothetical protein